MITIIDNYDSFTYNLVHYFGDLGVEANVYRNDEKTVAQVFAEKPEAIVLSPGPCTPNEAGICLELLIKNKGRIPVLGVCLGHQSIGQAYGGRVIRAPVPDARQALEDLPRGHEPVPGLESGFEATRYHSLIVEADTLPSCLTVTARTSDGLIMALEHKKEQVYGVQFHPESIASANGHAMLANFLMLAASNGSRARRGSNCPTSKRRRSKRPWLKVPDDPDSISRDGAMNERISPHPSPSPHGRGSTVAAVDRRPLSRPHPLADADTRATARRGELVGRGQGEGRVRSV